MTPDLAFAVGVGCQVSAGDGLAPLRRRRPLRAEVRFRGCADVAAGVPVRYVPLREVAG
jgi:hypothetical protein